MLGDVKWIVTSQHCTMNNSPLSQEQRQLLDLPVRSKIFLRGAAGSGKTTCALARLGQLLDSFPGHQILVTLPQRSLGNAYLEFLKNQSDFQGSMPTILTLSGLARKMIRLFWPIIADEHGFTRKQNPPYFLSTETSQYIMEKQLEPLFDEGFFQGITIERSRLYSQIMDNLNKAAIIGYPVKEIAERLEPAAYQEPALVNAFRDVQESAIRFRKFCLDHCLVDYSLQIELMNQLIWKKEDCRSYFYSQYKAVLCENVEEDVPCAHDLYREWIGQMESALVIFDENAGYRTFLGADPASAHSLSNACNTSMAFQNQYTMTPPMETFRSSLGQCIQHIKPELVDQIILDSYTYQDYRFYPEMISDTALQVKSLIQDHQVEPGDIVILTPYLSDALKFSLETRLSALNVPVSSTRPSHMWKESPSVTCMLSLSKLAHPAWELICSRYELRHAFMQILPDVDLVQAELIVKTLYSGKKKDLTFRLFDTITNPEMQERISFRLGEKLNAFALWFQEYQSSEPAPLDVFISRCFGELLSQPDFNFHNNYDAARDIAQLIHSIREFRCFANTVFGMDPIEAGFEYLQTIQSGLLPASFQNGPSIEADSVVISPAFTYLMANRPSRFQFWIDIGSLGWWERLNQPLTHPYVLSRNWDKGQQWTIAHEAQASQENLLKLVYGLTARCTDQIFLKVVQINEYGSEQRGPLMQALQTLQKSLLAFNEDPIV